jgi:hypothetical protein
MADRLEHLFQDWYHLGGAVLLAEVDTAAAIRQPEHVLAESTAYCRDSGRLTWVVLDWLIRHIDQIDAATLLESTQTRGDLSVLGVLCDAAQQRNPHPKFEQLIRGCVPHERLVPFFHRVARSPLATSLARESAVDVFLRWNYLCGEIRYLEDDSAQADRPHPTTPQLTG